MILFGERTANLPRMSKGVDDAPDPPAVLFRDGKYLCRAGFQGLGKYGVWVNATSGMP